MMTVGRVGDQDARGVNGVAIDETISVDVYFDYG
jgi:hypothetical protein